MALTPSQADFTNFLYNVVGISATVLPADSPTITMAYDLSINIVNRQLQCYAPDIYYYCVYYLGTHYVYQFAQDPTPHVPYVDGLPYFQYIRQDWGLNQMAFGITNFSGDQGTQTGVYIPESVRGLGLNELSLTKSPWGQQYLALAGTAGTMWGIT